MTIYPLIAVEGTVDRFCGRPPDKNPDCRATDEWASWDFGWIEAGCFPADRGQQEAARWLSEAA